MLNINFWFHLFDRTGFPFSRISYGHGWDSTLLVFSVTGEALLVFSYLLFVLVFILFTVAWKRGRIDRLASEKHVLRIAIAYMITTVVSAVVHIVNIYCYWVPLYRLAGLCLFVSGLTLFAAALKTLWAFTLCVIPKQKGTA